MPENKQILIASDCSNNTRYKISTWACYIKHPEGSIKHSARFNNFQKNTALLETLALANTLVLADKNLNLSEYTVIVYSEIADLVLRPLVTKKSKTPKASDTERTKTINEIMLPILEKAVSYEIQSVKAHYKNWQNSDNPTKYKLNRWCDQACRSLMREQMRYLRKTYNIAGKALAELREV